MKTNQRRYVSSLLTLIIVFAIPERLPAQGELVQSSSNQFNPAISVILDGRFASFSNNAEDYELSGFALGGEAGLGEEGISVAHTELVFSANVDNRFFGQVTAAVAEHEGATEVELEEAFIQSLGLGHGVTVKAGRFFSAIGYLNDQHEHAWDFADAPLIYRGLFGNQLGDNGAQISVIAPTDIYLQIGAEAFSGSKFPAGGEHEGVGSWSVFADIGGDLGTDHSWQAGVSHWSADHITDRTGATHAHDDTDTAEVPTFTGESKITAVDFVYKWAPNGNPKNRNFKLQFEYFVRDEDGDVELVGSDPLETTTYDGNQKGWYAQVVYQFMQQWRTGLRFDHLSSDNNGSDEDVLGEAGLDNEGISPKRTSVMVEWVPSEFSRVRLQFNRDESYEEDDNQWFLQYTMSVGAHGAHTF